MLVLNSLENSREVAGVAGLQLDAVGRRLADVAAG